MKKIKILFKKNIFTIFSFWLFSFISAGYSISIPVHYDTLKNGLRIIIVPDTTVAIVSCRLYYFVGSIYEGPGTTGLSHMYEHMMFKGTKRMGTVSYEKELPFMNTIDSLDALLRSLRQKGYQDTDSIVKKYKTDIAANLEKERKYIKKDEIWETYMNNGGTSLNAWTGDEITAYTVTLPENKLELFCWIEADRMQNPVLREFYSERDVVKEERKMRYENRPVNKYWEILNAHFYISHPYRQPTIGWMSDIESFSRAKLFDHINHFYTPDNALIVLVGNVKIDKSMELIKRYFEPISRSRFPKTEIVTREPAPAGETRLTMHDNAEPRIDILYHIPGYPDNDLFALDVLGGILSGRTGRLYKRLVTEEKICTNAGAVCEMKLHNGVFHAWATPVTDADPIKIESIILEEISKIAKGKPSLKEMERIKNSIQMDFVSSLKSQEVLSDQLAWFERLGSWKDCIEYPEKIANVTPEAVSNVTKKYLNPEYKTVGRLLAKKK